jgi:hypothetical protein
MRRPISPFHLLVQRPRRGAPPGRDLFETIFILKLIWVNFAGCGSRLNVCLKPGARVRSACAVAWRYNKQWPPQHGRSSEADERIRSNKTDTL